MEVSVVHVLFLLGAAHGTFIAATLFSNKAGPVVANRYLGLYTLLFVSALIDYFLDLTGLVNRFVLLRTLLWPKEFLYGALVYFYTRELTQPGKYALRGWQWLHFAPTFIHTLLTWPLLWFNQDFQLRVLKDRAQDSEFEQVWAFILGDFELFLCIAHMSIYIGLCLWLIVQHQIRIKDNYSNIEQINLNWLRNLLIGTLVVYLVWIAEELITTGPPLANVLDAALGLSMVCLIYGMSLLGLRQSTPITEAAVHTSELQQQATVNNNQNDHTDNSSEQIRYAQSGLSDGMSQALFQQLEALMADSKPYRDNSLSLRGLAEQMEISPNYLSQVINQCAHANFFDYVNRYRVAEVQSGIQGPTSQTVLAIALAAGFNSKSAFYTAFRKQTGMTPGQYKKSISIQ